MRSRVALVAVVATFVAMTSTLGRVQAAHLSRVRLRIRWMECLEFGLWLIESEACILEMTCFECYAMQERFVHS